MEKSEKAEQMIKAEVLVPLLNANEPEARLVEIHVKEGQEVAKGALLLTIETTKAAADVEAPEAGCVRLLAEEGAILEVGERLALITETADEPLDLKASAKKERASADGGPRLTKPARVLAEQLGLDLASLPSDRLLTEEAIRQLAGKPEVDVPVLKQVDPGKTLLIYGGGGHAKTVMEMARALGTFKIAGIIDDGLPAGTDILGIPVLGPREIMPGLVAQGVRLAANGVGGIVDINVRVRLFELLESRGFELPALVHPRAVVEVSAEVGAGVQVFANAYVGSSAVLAPKCMVNTGAIVSHDCLIGSYTHIAPGAQLAGHVHVGEKVLVGMGVKVVIGIQIGDGSRVGSGAIVLADVPPRTILKAGEVWRG